MNFKLNIPPLKIKIFPVFFSFLLVISGFLIGVRVGSNNGTLLGRDIPIISQVNRATPEHVDFALFWKMWDIVHTSYYDQSKVNEKNLIYGAIRGMVAAIGDPYTVFLTPEEQKVTEEDLSGNFDGIGIQIGFRGKNLAVIAPLPGTPAAEADIKAGDLIAGIKDDAKDIDKATDGLSLPEAVQIIRGPRGTTITLALIREGVDAPIIVDVMRETIDVPSVVLEIVGENSSVAHLKVLKFGGDTKAEWNSAVNEISSKKVEKVILDLRNNPGGYLQAAVDLASEFLPVGTAVVSEESGGKIIDTLKTETTGRLTNVELIVLVNQGSASASEILAGALRDQKKVSLIGETTFGKGTVQEPRELDEGVGIHITIAKWLTPSGYWVHDKGLVPDEEIKDNPDTTEDEVLLKAIELLEK